MTKSLIIIKLYIIQVFLWNNLSYVDCMGYSFAVKNGMKFLTDDIKFKDKESVEFVQ